MRFILVALAAFSISVVSFADDIKVSKENAIHFMRVIDQLQGLLYGGIVKMNTPEGVREFRDLARTLELHRETVGNIDSRAADESFARFMWMANPWVNRNLGFADEGNKFAKAFGILATYSDIAIAKDPKLQAPLIEAAESIMGSAGLERLVVEEKPLDPQGVVIKEKELEAAVAIAAVGLAYFPASIADAQDNTYYGLPKLFSSIYLYKFLKQPKALEVLRRRAKFSVNAAIALRLVENEDFLKAMDRVAGVLTQKGEGKEAQYEIKDAAKFKAFSGLLLGVAAVAREEAEAEIAPSKLQDINEPRKGIGAVKAKKGPLEEAEAKVISGVVHQMFEDLKVLSDRANAVPPNASYRGLRNSAYSLKMLLEYFAHDPRNHLSRLFYNVNPWAMRNWMSLTEEKESTTVLRRLVLAVSNKDGELQAVLKSIQGTTMLEGLARQENRNPVDLSAVGQQELLVTETYALGTVALGLQSLAVGLVNRAKSGQLTGAYAQHVTKIIHEGLLLLAARHEHLKFILAQYKAQPKEPFEIVEVRTAAALVDNLGKVLGALTFLENGFEAIDAADGSAPFTIEEGTRMLFELVTANQIPATKAGTGSDTGFCLGNVDALGKTQLE